MKDSPRALIAAAINRHGLSASFLILAGAIIDRADHNGVTPPIKDEHLAYLATASQMKRFRGRMVEAGVLTAIPSDAGFIYDVPLDWLAATTSERSPSQLNPRA